MGPTSAQVTNVCPTAPLTKLESFETNVNVLILKATSDLGTIAGNAGAVAVRCRETTDTSTGQKEQGLAIELSQKGKNRDAMLIDYDEISSLMNALDYLSRVDMSATGLNFLDAAYTTKGGLRLAALVSRRTGVVQFTVRNTRSIGTPVVLSRPELTQLQGLISQAKGILDSLRGG